MSGREIEGSTVYIPRIDAAEKQRWVGKAAVRIADQVGAENPTDADAVAPRLAGLALGRDPVIAAGVLELLDAIGLLEGQIAAAKTRNTRLKRDAP